MPESTALVGQHVQLTAQANCAVAGLEFQFTATDANNVLHPLQAFSSASALDWSTGAMPPGAVEVTATGRVSGGTAFGSGAVTYQLSDTSSLANGLVLHLADGNGTDSSGTGGDLTTHGSNATLAADRYGRADHASLYAPGAGYIGSPAQLPTGAAPRTLSAWVRTSATSQQTIFGQGNNTCGSGELDIYLTDLSPSATACNVFAYSAASPLPSDQWALLSVTYDGSSLAFYVNGSQVGSTSSTLSSGSTFFVGFRQLTGQDLYAGYLDDVRVYNRVLSASELAHLALVDL